MAEDKLSRNGKQHERQSRAVSLVLLSVLVGVLGGLGAVFFRDLIAFFHNLLFLGKLSITYDANTHTPASYLGPFVILVPVVGAAGVVFLVRNFAPEAKGRGVGEVMDAVYTAKGQIRPIVAIIKPLASAISIGTGGSLGREGPIVQIASSIGSTIGQVLTMPPWQRITLIAAGAGAGIAATFNAPVGGALFALEIIVNEISVRTLVPIIVATAAGTYVGRLFFGTHPSFIIPALADITFAIPANRRAALVGPSGAGKSTLVNLLLRFWGYHTGSIKLGGIELRELSQEDVRRAISVVSQSTYLFNATVRDNLSLARPEADEPQLIQAARQAGIHDTIRSLPDGYDTWIGERGLQLSGGERQRLAIARAILKDAPILLLDEPTASLDTIAERQIMEQLEGLMASRTTLLVTHRLVGLQAMDQILVLQNGRLIERGPHHELASAGGLYAQLWRRQREALT
jgi:ABC-type multidrug transport system ATPase subunit